MRSLSLVSLLALVACDGGTTPTDTGIGDTGAMDSGTVDTGRGDTGRADTATADTATADTATADTATADTATADAASGDTTLDATGDSPDAASAFCALPASAPFGPAGDAGFFDHLAITWDGTSCGVTSDGADPDAILVFTNLAGLAGQSQAPWMILSASAGTLLGGVILDAIPEGTPITLQLGTTASASLELTFTLSTATGITLTAFSEILRRVVRRGERRTARRQPSVR